MAEWVIGEDFDPDSFWYGASNKHDHRSKIVIYVPPEMDFQLEKIVQSKKWPLDSKQQLIRRGIAFALHDLHRRDPESLPADFLEAMRVDAETETRLAMQESHKQRLADANKLAAGSPSDRILAMEHAKRMMACESDPTRSQDWQNFLMIHGG